MFVALMAGAWLVVVDSARAVLSGSATLGQALPATGGIAAGTAA
jgi:hypothetical protein